MILNNLLFIEINYIINIKNKSACIVSFLNGRDKKSLNPKNCYEIGKMIAKMHLSTRKINLYRKNSMSIKNLKKGIKLAKKYYETEASGNISLKTIKSVAATGVNRISVGSITHSASAIDLKLEI